MACPLASERVWTDKSLYTAAECNYYGGGPKLQKGIIVDINLKSNENEEEIACVEEIGTSVVIAQKSPTKKSKKNKKDKANVSSSEQQDNVQSPDDANNVKKTNKKEKNHKSKQLNKQATNDSATDLDNSLADNDHLLSSNKVVPQQQQQHQHPNQQVKNAQSNANNGGAGGNGNNSNSNATEKSAAKQKKAKKQKDKKANNNAKENVSSASDDTDNKLGVINQNNNNSVNAKNEVNATKAAKDKKNKADKNKLPSSTPPPSPITAMTSIDIDDFEEKGGNPGQCTLASEIAKARQHIKNSLERMDGIAALASTPGAELLDRISSVEKENKRLNGVVESLQKIVNDLQSRVKSIESNKGSAAPASSSAPAASKPAAKEEDDEDDGVDLFASDSEDDDGAAELREKRLAEYNAKKSKKPALIAKSNIILDIKPWDDETDMKQMEVEVRKIVADGLLFGTSKLVPLAYGIHKLVISSVVEDEKISVDWLIEEIQKIEDFVQSVDIAAFNKI